ncbi:MAG: ABC transporter substrate-binding protein, partial [Moorea sp. SIO2B7]|nr:ABC transporter substrate-binding protein [Moorena sp. SIO2B7]
MVVLRRLHLPIILILLIILTITGYTLNQFKTKTDQASKLVLVTPNDPDSFNFAINNIPYSVFGFIYNGLLNQNGVTAELEPALAESWEISEDKLRIIFTLRKDLKWSDGEPLTADDVMFTYNKIYLNKKIPTAYRDLLRIGNTGALPSIKKLDNRRVEFTVPEPYAPFLRYTGELPILPVHALRESIETTDANGNIKFLSTWGTDTDPRKIICNGPYRMVSYTPSQRVIFQRNPYYWRRDVEGNSQPYIERLILQIIPSTDNQLLKFRSGELDSIRVTSEAFELLKKEEKQGKYKVYNGGPGTGVRFVGFNLNKGRNSQGKPFVDKIKSRWFNSLAFRQAVAYAIDRERMKNNIYRGLGEILHSPIAVQSPYYLSPQKGLKVYNYDLQKAKQILLNAGFTYNSNQELLDWDGNRVEFTILVKSEEKSRIDTAVQIKQDLSKIGIQADLQVLTLNLVIKKLLASRDWHCYVGAFPG